MTLVVDTSFLIDFERGDPRTDDLFERLGDNAETLLIPSIVLAEYVAGARNPEEAREALERAGEVLPFTTEDAMATAELAGRMFRKGVFPGWVDAMVAGVAKARGDVAILTRNPRHFPESRTVTY